MLYQFQATDEGFSITLRQASPEETFQIVRYSLGKIPWYKEHGYKETANYWENLAIPEIQKMRLYAPLEQYEKCFSAFERFYHSEIGHLLIDNNQKFKDTASFFEKKLPAVSSAFKKMSESGLDFQICENYQILFNPIECNGKYAFPNKVTLAGAMGRTEAGTLFHTAIHEMVHLGIEESVVKRLGLTHPEKERLVDNLCNYVFDNEHFQQVGKQASYMDKYCAQLLKSGHLSNNVLAEIKSNIQQDRNTQKAIIGYFGSKRSNS